MNYYSRGSVIIPTLLGVIAVLAVITVFLSLQNINRVSDGPLQTEVSPTPVSLPTKTNAKDLPTSTSIPTQPPDLSPLLTTLKSDVCPVEFEVPDGKMNIPSKGQPGEWQLVDRDNERFAFVPRAEENNGRRTTVELRADGQIYYNPQISVDVYCQDNANKWNSTTLMDYVVKSEGLGSTSVAKTKLWGRDVYKLTYKYSGDDVTRTNWFFATPSNLFRIEKNEYDQDFATQLTEVFNKISFFYN